MKLRVVIYLLMPFFASFSFGQEAYNTCNNALELCPLQVYTVNNLGANKTLCANCEDDFNFCFTANNTIWFKFTTNTVGGNVSVAFNNLIFQNTPGQGIALQATLLEATVPCQSDTYTAIGNCEANGQANFTLNATGLLANTTYYIVVSGDLSGNGGSVAAECTFDISATGPAVDRSSAGVVIDGSVTSVCINQAFTANAIIFDCPDNSPFTWYVNGVLVAVTSDHFYSSSDIQDGDIISVETNCYAQCSQFVTAASNPISVYSFPLNAGVDQVIEQGATTQLLGSTTATTYEWTPSYNISDTLSLTPFVQPEETTIYTLTATQNGCTQYDYVTISIDDPLIIPTTFSPNEDGINDTWEIGGVEKYPNCFVQIFNRWGQEIFQSTGYTDKKAWDGTINEKAAAEGVYFYIVKLRDDEKKEFKGSITLIR